ncbi:MAG: hypothetical protein QW791_02525 [Candidatus Bathyarchaeia archaeon]
MYFTKRIKIAITEVAPKLPIHVINMFEERDGVKKRGQAPLCVSTEIHNRFF